MPINFDEVFASMSAAAQRAATRAKNEGMDATNSMAVVMSAFVATAVKTLVARVNELESQIEQQPQLRYMGIWQEGMTYSKGWLATDRGSLWHANFETRERPGSPGHSWTLVAKRGADGKDLRQ